MQFIKKCILVCFLFLSFACQKRNRSFYEKNQRVKVLCTISMIEDVVKMVGKEHIDTLSLIQGNLDPHSYELCKGDSEKFEYADVVLYNGLGLEHGASLHYQLEHNEKAIAVGEWIDSDKRIIVDGATDPHIWMDVGLFANIVDPITQLLGELDKEHAPIFLQNAQVLKENMCALHQEMFEALKDIDINKRQLITTHDAFRYFVRAYMAPKEEVTNHTWHYRLTSPEGLAPEGQVSTLDIRRIVDFAIDRKTHVLFAESNLSKTSLKKICDAAKKNGFELKIADRPLFGDAMMQTEKAFSYGKTMLYNAQTIKEALSEVENE